MHAGQEPSQASWLHNHVSPLCLYGQWCPAALQYLILGGAGTLLSRFTLKESSSRKSSSDRPDACRNAYSFFKYNWRSWIVPGAYFSEQSKKELLYLDSADTLQIFKALVFQPCKIFSGRPAHVTSRVRVGSFQTGTQPQSLKLRRQSLPLRRGGTGKQSLNTGKGIGDKAVNLPPRPLIMASLHAPVKILPVNLSCVGTDGIPVKIFKAFCSYAA